MIVERLMPSEAIVVVEEASQPAFRAGLAGVPRLMEAVNPHRNRLKEFLNDVSVAVIEISAEISPGKSGEIAHPVNERLCVFDAVTVFELPKEPRRGLRAPTR